MAGQMSKKREKFIAISCGNDFTYGLREDGIAVYWNKDTYSQSSGENHYTSISAGSGHSCALRDDGVIFCAGAIMTMASLHRR